MYFSYMIFSVLPVQQQIRAGSSCYSVLFWLFSAVSKESLAQCSFGLWSALTDFMPMLDKSEQATGEQLLLISSFKAWRE